MKKPTDLHLPYSWEGRRVYATERFLHVPWDIAITDAPDIAALFDTSQPMEIEYCSGNGSWIVDKAQNAPSVNFVAVEMRFDRARKIWTKMHNRNVSNLLVVWSEGLTFTRHCMKNQSVDAVYINFPDPWPKRRHAVHRIIKRPFIEEMHRILRSQGMFTIVTDDAAYSDSIIREVVATTRFQPVLPPPFFAPPSETYGTSFFHELFSSKGKEIRLHQFRPFTEMQEKM